VGHGTALLFLLAWVMVMTVMGGNCRVAQSLRWVRRGPHGWNHPCGHGGACQATQDQQHHQE